jgi:23S rRNA (adenine2030-N6)-methyltransferase
MKMNGCALVFLPAVDLDDPLAAIARWVAQALGEGGASRVYRLPPS